MAKSHLIHLNWDSLLIPEDLSAAEVEEHAAAVSSFLSNLSSSSQSTDTADLVHVTEITIDDSLVESHPLEMDKLSNEQLFEYLQEEKTRVDSTIPFPKIKRINTLFWFLHNLGRLDIEHSKIAIDNPQDLSINYYRLIEAAVFFDFLTYVQEADENYLIPTSLYKKFINQPIKKQYSMFLHSLSQNETISEILQVQLNDSIYDNISRQMVYNILVVDPNIRAESLAKQELEEMVNNFRYWFFKY